MHRYSRTGKHRWTVRALAVLFTALLGLTQWTAPASAHGSVINPATRNYGCWLRWGHDHLNPNMQYEDPMCWQAWQANPNAMWNWNGLYRDGSAATTRRPSPTASCAAVASPKAAATAPWTPSARGRPPTSATTSPSTLYDQASHGADYFLVYVTKQGFDPTTQPLTWNSLELVTRPAATPRPRHTVHVHAPGRSGRHVVFTIWKASHMDQTYYLCSDVNFV